MKNKHSIVQNRRQRLIEFFKKNGVANVEELAKEFQVSLLTIRRDLQWLEKKCIVERFYGGARLIEAADKYISEIEIYKQKIAQKAAEFIEDGDSVFINTSSTALLVMNYLTAKHVTIITNNGNAIFAECKTDTSVVLTGGELRHPKESMTGEFALNNLAKVSASKAIIGCSGISAEEGFSTSVLQEVAINEAMLDRCIGATIVVADHTKIGFTSNFISGAISKVHCLITDELADNAMLSKIADQGVIVITA